MKTGDFEEGYSVLMSVYEKERPEYFKASIRSMLAQTLPCSDFVLVCDGALNDGLENVIEWAAGELGERFQCIRLAENRGLGNALRIGVRYCRCAAVARMDSDDISRPDRCRRQMEIMKKGGYEIVGGNLLEFIRKPGDTQRMRILPETPEEIMKFAGKRNPFNHPCVMFLKDAVLKAGNYQDFPGFEDYHLWIRMLKDGCRGFNIQEIVLDMRTGNGMYARRGGWPYIKSIIHFQKFLRQQKMIGTGQFVRNCFLRSMVAAVPGNLRSRLYDRFLRGKSKRSENECSR